MGSTRRRSALADVDIIAMDKIVEIHNFRMPSNEDPYLYAAEPLSAWEKTDKGKWAKQNAQDLHFLCIPDHSTFGYTVRIMGKLSSKARLYMLLKWGIK